MDDHQHRQDKYSKKKFQQTKHKKTKETFTEQEDHLVKTIGQMNAKSLLNFIQGKYDRLTNKNEKLLYPINNQIIKRIPQIRDQFAQGKNNKIFEYIAKHTNRQLDKQEKKKIIQYKYGNHTFDTKPKVMIKGQYHEVLKSVLLVILDPNQQGQKIEKFYFGDCQKEFFYQVTYKRIKKEAIQILSNFIEFQAKVDKLKYIK